MILNSKYKPKSEKYKLLYNNKLQTTQPDLNTKPNIITNTCVTLYLSVHEPTQLTTGSIQVSRVLGGPGQKLTRIEIYKIFSTQSGLNP